MFKHGFESETGGGTDSYLKLEQPREEPHCIIVTSEHNDGKPYYLDEPVCVDVYGGEPIEREHSPTKRYNSLREYLKTLDD